MRLRYIKNNVKSNSPNNKEDNVRYNKDNLKYVQIIRGNNSLFLPVLLVSVLICFIIGSIYVLKVKYNQEDEEIATLAKLVNEYNIVFEKVPLTKKELDKVKRFSLNEMDKPNNYITSILTEEKDILFILNKRQNYKPYTKPTTAIEKFEHILSKYDSNSSKEKIQYEKDYVVSKYKLKKISAVAVDKSILRDTYFQSIVPHNENKYVNTDSIPTKEYRKLLNDNSHLMMVDSIPNLRSLSDKMNSVGFFYGILYYKYNHVPNAVFVDATVNVKENQQKILFNEKQIIEAKQTFMEFLISTGKLNMMLSIILHLILVNLIISVLSQLDNRLTKDLYFVTTEKMIHKKQFANLLHYDYFNHSRYIFFSLLWIPLMFAVLIMYLYQPLAMYIEYRSDLADNLLVFFVVGTIIYTMNSEKEKIYLKSSSARNNLRKTLAKLDENTNKGLDANSMDELLSSHIKSIQEKGKNNKKKPSTNQDDSVTINKDIENTSKENTEKKEE